MHETLFDKWSNTLQTDRIQRAFDDFHADNPDVYDELVRLARIWRTRGLNKLGIATLFEVLRWENHMNGVRDKDGYKLNNNYRALYARLIMEQESDLDGLFDIRERTATIERIA